MNLIWYMRYVNLLLNISIILGEYGNWNGWSACSVRCGEGKNYKYRGCKNGTCHNQLFEIATKDCSQSCPGPSRDFGNCTKASEYLPLYEGGHNVVAGFPFIYSSKNFCPLPGQYFTITATEIPFLLKIIYFHVSWLEKVFLDYTIEYGSNTWYPYVKQDGGQVPLHQLETEVNIFEVNFENKFPVYAVRLSVQSFSSCYQLTVHGCHTPYDADLSFENEVVEEILNFTSQSKFNFQYNCSINYIPMYSKYLKITNAFVNKNVSEDSNQVVYAKVTHDNTQYVDGLSTISLFVKVESMATLEDDFYCYNESGVIFCHTLFVCTGKKETILGEEYSQGKSGLLHLIFKTDVNECLNETICSEESTCVNTFGSYYCECVDGYYGNGRDCFVESEYVLNKMGTFNTGKFPFFPIQDTYCRMLFYASKTDSLYACSQYGAESAFGCMISLNFGGTWKAIFPGVDFIFGEDASNGIILGHGNERQVFFLYDPLPDRWYCISETQFKQLSSSPTLNSNRVVNPKCSDNTSRDDVTHPSKQAIYPIYGLSFAITKKGVAKLNGESWETLLNWIDLPEIYNGEKEIF